MSIFEDDLNASERNLFNQLGILASLELDEMEDHEREREFSLSPHGLAPTPHSLV